jgi:flagellar biogenesis protein FliO
MNKLKWYEIVIGIIEILGLIFAMIYPLLKKMIE